LTTVIKLYTNISNGGVRNLLICRFSSKQPLLYILYFASKQHSLIIREREKKYTHILYN